MGAENSVPVPAPTTPWVHPRLRQSILDISDSSEAFLHPDPQYYQQFDLNDAIMPHLKGALIHDPRCNMWLAKLVPKRISEVEFWRNYFSHVAAVNAKAPVKKLRAMQRHSETGSVGHSGAASGDSSSSDESSSDDEPGEHSRPITHHPSQTSTSHPSQTQISAPLDTHSLEPPQQQSLPTTPPSTSTSQAPLPPRAPPRPPNVEIPVNNQSVPSKRGSVVSPLTRAPSPLLPQNARIGPDGAVIDEPPPPATSCIIS